MTFRHIATATSNKARTTPTYIRDVPVILYAPPPTQGPKVRHTSRSRSSGGPGSFWRKHAVLCLSPAGPVLLPARFKTDLARTRHMLCLGRKLASLIGDSKIYFPVATRCGNRNTACVATKIPQERPLQRCRLHAMVYGEHCYRCRLIVTHLEYRPSTGHQHARGICKDGPIGIKAVRAAVQCPVWLPLGHLRREGHYFIARDVGRVRYQEVVAAVHFVKPPRPDEADAVE